MKIKLKKSETKIDPFDEILFEIAKKDKEPIPKNIHSNILKTIDELDEKEKKSYTKKDNNSFKFSFKEKLTTIISQPIKTLTVSCLSVVLIASSVVCARNISEKFCNKDNVRLDNIGIANEFIFTDEMENALKQNVPLNLIQLNEDYYIHIDSILLDEINFFTVFELHCKNGVTDDLRFTIRDLEISDEKGNVLYTANKEFNTNSIKGYNHIYNTENSIKKLFFMFGNDNSEIKELNFSFSNIEIYRHDTQLNPNPEFNDIFITSEKQNIKVPITKDNYNTIQEYILKTNLTNNIYNIQQALLTGTGLYITMQSNSLEIAPLIKTNNQTYSALYRLPLKREGRNNILMLLAYNLKHNSDTISLYNNLDKNIYKLIQKK